jgi:hypothetical protein
MRRLPAILAITVALLAPLAVATAASANINSCHLSAGKVVAWTATTTRSVDARWPGMACTYPGDMWIYAQLWQDQGGRWVGGTSAIVGFAYGLVVPAGAGVFHCTHRALTQIRLTYQWKWPARTLWQGFAATNVAVCS